MSDYHRYVFDTKARRFVGDFEAMYQAEQTQGFDSWHQEDERFLDKQICLALLSGYNFARVLDIGCGKGTFTQHLKKANNEVVAFDLSPTALRVAQARYPDIRFVRADLAAPGFDVQSLSDDGLFDLVVCLETLSYVEGWRDLIAQLPNVARHALIALHLPDNPIGYVKSFAELQAAFVAHFELLEDILMPVRQKIILFGKAKPPAAAGQE